MLNGKPVLITLYSWVFKKIAWGQWYECQISEEVQHYSRQLLRISPATFWKETFALFIKKITLNKYFINKKIYKNM